MVEKVAEIQNSQGIHCRPSSVIVQSVAGYEGRIQVVGEHGNTNLRSIMELMSMELYPGSRVTVRVEGPDEEVFCSKVVALFERHFDFPQAVAPVPTL